MKRGFTLVEMLGVIVMLAALTIVSYPLLFNTFNKKEEQIDSYKLDLIYIGAEKYVNEHINDFPYIKGNNVCVPIITLINENYVSIDLEKDIKSKFVKLVMKGDNKYTDTIDTTCSYTKDGNQIKLESKICNKTDNIEGITYNQDIIYFFEKTNTTRNLVKEYNEITIENVSKNSDYDSKISFYVDLYNMLSKKKGINAYIYKGENKTTLKIQIDYNNVIFPLTSTQQEIISNTVFEFKNLDDDYTDIDNLCS